MNKTLDFVAKNDHQNLWIIRAHPSSKNNNERIILKNYIKQKFHHVKNVIFCPQNIPINELYDICDVVVTGKGTIGLEFLSEGKNCILAGEAPYSKVLGFKNNITRKKYFNEIKNIRNLKKISNKKKLLAKKILLFYEKGYHVNNSIDLRKINNIRLSEYITNKNKINIKKFFEINHKLLKQDIKNTKFFKDLLKLI